MEDDLKMLKVKHFSNFWLDLSKIWNGSLGLKLNLEMIQTKMTSNKLYIKLTNLSKHWLDHTQILNFDQIKLYKYFK